jgi:hypothetical protein
LRIQKIRQKTQQLPIEQKSPQGPRQPLPERLEDARKTRQQTVHLAARHREQLPDPATKLHKERMGLLRRRRSPRESLLK